MFKKIKTNIRNLNTRQKFEKKSKLSVSPFSWNRVNLKAFQFFS